MADPLYTRIVEAVADDSMVKKAFTVDEIILLKKQLMDGKLPKKEIFLASLAPEAKNEN